MTRGGQIWGGGEKSPGDFETTQFMDGPLSNLFNQHFFFFKQEKEGYKNIEEQWANKSVQSIERCQTAILCEKMPQEKLTSTKWDDVKLLTRL